MRVVIAIDSFKGCASSKEVALGVKRGVQKVYEDALVQICAVADGGEGTVEALGDSDGARFINLICKDPLGKDVEATYAILKDSTAVIEMASASGLPLVPKEQRDPKITSTYGTGELICDAIKQGCREFIVGIGGSATNDAGLGMLRALGYKFFDKDDNEVSVAKKLSSVYQIDDSNLVDNLQECHFYIACDVNNPLCGENGATYVYGSQKGATKEDIEFLDHELKSFSKTVSKKFGKDVSKVSGTGAAGGLGYAFLAFLDATLKSGIRIVLEKQNFESKIDGADFVITGEGRIDRQSVMGKVLDGIGSYCKDKNIPCIALGGGLQDIDNTLHEKGIASVFSIIDRPMSLEEAMDKDTALKLIEQKTEHIFRLLKTTM